MRLIAITTNGNFDYQTKEAFIEAMERNGYTLKGVETNHRLRTELQGQPKFEGLAGPMWDGDKIRYEDWSTNERMSI